MATDLQSEQSALTADQATSPSTGTSTNRSTGERYQRIRAMSVNIAAPLTPEDCAMQTMPDVSPTRWHLAHTTWFFETFLLKEQPGFRPFHSDFERLFNSYYNSVGEPFPRHRRGQLSRPGLEETLQYRQHVDVAVSQLIDQGELNEHQRYVLELGLHHEQQHQELMLTDIKHVLASNPLYPIYTKNTATNNNTEASLSTTLQWSETPETIVEIGHNGKGFAYDNESPRHRELIQPHAIADRCVTNGEYLEFINAGGYQQPEHWLSLGWTAVNENGWKAPQYWVRGDEDWRQFTLSGLRPLDLHEPVCHVSYFEADAYARWSGKRLPTEFEWEHAATANPTGSVFADRLMESGHVIHPRTAGASDFTGNVWEWTGSQYLPYPGYRPVSGALGEYNGKFMCNQFVLRGGSCATSSDHIRLSYRNFFPPDARWQFSGFRLADSR
ncbi:ergothioneine biosynthesis protein EgtB [Rhodopirellula sallentina]|uniref:Formylglycine-generating sulfatase enzyme n=1 Tax=Rhodopirellula sallentina SM41 TaxID=1263870 RepID=M5UBW1_9BACT|nr:ergothioneine biosynthesis protein EgtB [Rhodopirellula sallentina]EMI55341.1 Formylglycine-generating sulfatase enzyme [Rhodopirellula sallentina SM41]